MREDREQTQLRMQREMAWEEYRALPEKEREKARQARIGRYRGGGPLLKEARVWEDVFEKEVSRENYQTGFFFLHVPVSIGKSRRFSLRGDVEAKARERMCYPKGGIAVSVIQDDLGYVMVMAHAIKGTQNTFIACLNLHGLRKGGYWKNGFNMPEEEE